MRGGEHVGILLATEVLEQLAYSYGAARLGAVAVCINARFKARELTFSVTNSGLKLLLTSSWFAVLATADFPGTCRVVDIAADSQFMNAAAAVSEQEVQEETARVRGEDPVRVIYTSGTTSMPKACPHMHHALIAQGEAVAMALSLTAADRFWRPLPIPHRRLVSIPGSAVSWRGIAPRCTFRGIARAAPDRRPALHGALSGLRNHLDGGA